MEVWLNGHFIPIDDARVSAFDAGLQHAVGLFETMLARRGKIFRPEAHMERLERSATELRLTERLHTDALAQAVDQTIERNGLTDARIRLTVSGGDLNLLTRSPERRPKSAVDPTILIHAQPPQKYPDEFFDRGVTATVANARLNPLNPFESHKTLNYWPRLFQLQNAAAVGAAESLWFTVSNHLAGGSVSNVFVVKDGVIETPIARGEEETIAGEEGVSLPSPVLPGITRDTIFNICEAEDRRIVRRMLDINDVLGADEVFLTNSSWGVLPVTRVERETIGDGKVGDVTTHLREAWLRRTGAPGA